MTLNCNRCQQSTFQRHATSPKVCSLHNVTSTVDGSRCLMVSTTSLTFLLIKWAFIKAFHRQPALIVKSYTILNISATYQVNRMFKSKRCKLENSTDHPSPESSEERGTAGFPRKMKERLLNVQKSTDPAIKDISTQTASRTVKDISTQTGSSVEEGRPTTAGETKLRVKKRVSFPNLTLPAGATKRPRLAESG